MTTANIHKEQPVTMRGVPLAQARAAMILIHGRGSDANGIIPLINHFEVDHFTYLAPNAANSAWYPQRFIEPRESNQPYLTSALAKVEAVLQEVQDAGISPEKVILLGFSQGACLATEFAARNPRRYGGVVALSGGLIGTDAELTGYEGSLAETPVFIGCSDVDFHIPVERVHQTRDIMQRLGATVDERIYEGMGHTINDDEVAAVNAMMQSLL
ncbi:MAG: alpha/beta hydrolase [Anaerolineae bacterium]